DGVVVADLAGGDEDAAEVLHRDPAAPEKPASGIDQCRGGVAVDGAAVDHPHDVAAGAADAIDADASLIEGRGVIDGAAPLDDYCAALHVDAAAESVGGLVVTHGTAAVEREAAAGGVDAAAAASEHRVRTDQDPVRENLDGGQRQVGGAVFEY